MSNFKTILKIEKKYEKIINDANKKVDLNMEKFLDELKLKDSAYRQDYKKELERDHKRSLNQIENKCKKNLDAVKEEAINIKKNAKKKQTIDFLMGEIKNV